MRLTSSLAVSSLVLAAALGGCARVDVHSATVRGTTYVRTDEVLKHHPLYPQLEKLENAVTAITLANAGPRVPRSAAEIAAQTKELDRELKDAQQRANAALAAKQQSYQKQEQDAINAALAASGNANAQNAGQQMSANSAQQAQAAYAAANRDMQSYQQSVVAQDSAAVSSIAAQLNKEANEKLNARALQYQQAESDLSEKLTQQDASQRLGIKTKLNNLAMDDATHKQLLDELAAIDKKESDQVAAMRKEHAQAMAAYRTQVESETSAKIAAQAGAVHAQTRSKLQEHSAAVGAQIRSLSAPPVSANIPPDVQRRLQTIQAQFAAKFQADAKAEVAHYNETKADLDRQFAALHGQDVGATGAQAKALKSLQDQHDKLMQQMIDQITREAVRIAKDRGFTVVFQNVAGAAGGYDLTSDLISDVESLHE